MRPGEGRPGALSPEFSSYPVSTSNLMKTITPLILAAPLFLAGCSLEPMLQRVTTPVSTEFPGNTGGDISADISWQKFFTDPRLKKLVSLALDNNRDLRVAALNVEQVRAQYRISRADLFPTVDLSASGTRARTPGSLAAGRAASESHSYDVSVGVTAYELDLFGRVSSLNHQALEQYFASDAARVGAQISLVAEVANQYFTERALLEQIDLSEQTLKAVSDTYNLTNKRFEAGDVSELDLRSVDIQVQTAKANLAAFNQQLAQSRNAMGVLLGSGVPGNLPGGRTLEEGLVAEVKAGVPSSLLQRRPDIREAEHQLQGANANIGAARAAFFPRVTLTGSAGTASASFDHLFQSGTTAWSFAPQISVPIFDGGRNKATLDAAVLGKDIQFARYEKAIQTAFREVADGLAARSGLNDQIKAYDGLVEAQQKRFDLATARYDQGVDSYFEVLTAQQDLFNAKQTRIRLRLSRASNSVNLYKALGGGW
ncbi:MAG: multidrug efflux system protein [Akkermansiaceae bacterium]|nr:multidrug efflux system protein [Akkermansiaceae bacterium]